MYGLYKLTNPVYVTSVWIRPADGLTELVSVFLDVNVPSVSQSYPRITVFLDVNVPSVSQSHPRITVFLDVNVPSVSQSHPRITVFLDVNVRTTVPGCQRAVNITVTPE